MRKSKHREDRPRARLNWDDIRVFAAVAEAGSVNKAAVELKITPPSVSRRIEDLETRLEVRLFQRAPTGMTLTSAGKDLLDRAQSMQRFADDIERSVRARDRRDEGGVTIVAPDGIGSLWVAPRIADFLSRNPKIQVALDCRIGPAPDSRPDITIALDRAQAQDGDDITPLATMHYVFLAAPAYLETYGTPRSAASAAGDHRTLKHTGQVSQREAWSARAAAVEMLADFSFETNSSAALVQALRAGAGVATAPTYLLTSAPELVMVGAEQSVPIKLWLIVHQESRNAARVTRVADWLKSIFDTRANPWFREEFIPPAELAASIPETPQETPAPRRRRT